MSFAEITRLHFCETIAQNVQGSTTSHIITLPAIDIVKYPGSGLLLMMLDKLLQLR